MNKEQLKNIFSLSPDQASDNEIRERIHSGATVTGTNMYILIFAILIACIGLNMNSTAVVIGAMLISPLMSVIISLAYGITFNNLKWIKKSLQKFSFQIAISIITSTIYFSLSPIHLFSGELAARTQPTIWDVLIALFGGAAAIIATTRKSMIGNVLPGAAIATALMPPLCTVGYCLSSGKWLFALGAGYLFSINTLFICFSSVVGLYLMKITSGKQFLHTKKSRIIMGVFLVIAIVPSAVLAWQTVSGISVDEKITEFVEHEFQFEDTQVIKSNINRADKKIEVMLIGSILDGDSIQKIEKKLSDYNLDTYELEVIQTNMEQGISRDDLNEIINSDKEIYNDMPSSEEIIELKSLIKLQADEKEQQNNAAKELRILYPSVTAIGFSQLYSSDDTLKLSLILESQKKLSQSELDQIESWLTLKFGKTIPIFQVTSNN